MREIKTVLWSIAIRLQNELVLVCPVDGSGLVNSIRVRPNSTNSGLIISMNENGKYVEFGTPPHIIRAKDKGVLHWHKTKGRTQHSHPHSSAMQEDAFFAKEVKHPGTRPNPFIRNTVRNKLPKIIQEEMAR